MEVLFWLSLFFVIYTFAGYPLTIYMLTLLRRKPVSKGDILPKVSVVIAALNEEKNISKRIDNLLAQDYPKDMLEIIVVSDGSTDKTEEIVRSFNDKKIILYPFEKRRGKAEALNYGVSRASGEIIVFADARQIYKSDAIRHLTANFSDPCVGCVSGELLFFTDAESCIDAEMGAYWRYEKWIRKNESESGSVMGATGAIYAIRKALHRPLPAGTILDDVLTPLRIVMQGYRTVFDSKAIAYDVVSKDMGQEWKRKVRTLAGNWQLLNLFPSLVLPWRNIYWWRFLSHKIFRLLIPFALLTALLTGFILDGALFRFLTLIQLTFYAIAFFGLITPAVRKFRVVNLTCFFLILNIAALVGFWMWIGGKCQAAWQPAYSALGETK